MKIVATPMCAGILKIAGVTGYHVSRRPDMESADLAVVLSESSVSGRALRLKVNTFPQIKEALKTVIEVINDLDSDRIKYSAEEIDFDVCSPWWHEATRRGLQMKNSKIKVKVYSNFLKEIVEDMGFLVVHEGSDFTVCPDYMDLDCIKVPSHRNLPQDPVKRALFRYRYLERKLCMRP